MRMLGSPPLPHPEGESVASAMRAIQRMVRMRVFVRDCFRRVFQRKRKETGRRQRMVRLRAGCVRAVELAGLTVVMVLMVAMAVCAVPLRGMPDGRREHAAYWPGLMGVQLRTTVPV